jgi:hypothetical protein
MILPIILLLGAAAATIALLVTRGDTPPVHDPDLPMVPGSTRYRRVDAILGLLKQAAAESGIPLGVLVGWIAKESGGKLKEVTKLDERGYFQLMPDESKSLGLDHARLSTDSVYSINAGLLAIGQRMREADALGIAPRGSSYYWRLVKLGHTMGAGDTKKLANAAKAAGQAGSWSDFERFALSGAVHTKHSPAKWFPFIDELYRVGAPFGFGTDAGTFVVGAAIPGTGYTDIPDPLNLIRRRKRW